MLVEKLEGSIFKDRQQLARHLQTLRDSTQKKKQTDLQIVFTNGCFDILHRGHVYYLNRARELGDVLVLGLNSDASVRGLKGQGRPINTWQDRAFVLAGLSAVDYVVYFDEPTPIATLDVIKPDIHCKGGDYKLEDLPERNVVLEHGGRIEILNFVDGYSTSHTIEKMNQSG